MDDAGDAAEGNTVAAAAIVVAAATTSACWLLTSTELEYTIRQPNVTCHISWTSYIVVKSCWISDFQNTVIMTMYIINLQMNIKYTWLYTVINQRHGYNLQIK